MNKVFNTSCKSSFAGFLDGYKAGNLAYLNPSLSYHFSIIKIQTQEALNYIEGRNTLLFLKEYFSTAFDILNDAKLDWQNKAIRYGESLLIIFEHSGKKDFDEVILRILRKITYHFLSIADEIKDKQLVSISISIGEKIK